MELLRVHPALGYFCPTGISTGTCLGARLPEDRTPSAWKCPWLLLPGGIPSSWGSYGPGLHPWQELWGWKAEGTAGHGARLSFGSVGTGASLKDWTQAWRSSPTFRILCLLRERSGMFQIRALLSGHRAWHSRPAAWHVLPSSKPAQGLVLSCVTAAKNHLVALPWPGKDKPSCSECFFSILKPPGNESCLRED